MKPTRFVLALLIALSIPAAPLQQLSAVQPSNRADVASLKDILEKGLRAYRPTDFTYITKVIGLVNTGKLTRRFVLSTFHYVRRKYRFKRYLVPYFQRALTIRAAKIGVAV